MILIHYIIKEVYKNQLIVLMILFLVCVCQKFLKMLNLVVDENVSFFFVIVCLLLSIPELGKLIVPFSLFISVPITFYRLHIYNEIIAMCVCSVNRYIFIGSVLFFSGIVVIFLGVNILWLAPYCGYYQHKVFSEVYKNIDYSMLTERKIQFLADKRLVLFVDSIQDAVLKHVFLTRKNNDALTIIVADQGDICHVSNVLKIITLTRGMCCEIFNKNKLYEEICISKFLKYQISLDQDNKMLPVKNEVNFMSIYQLWTASSREACIEFHWRLTLLVSVIIMPIISTLLFIMIPASYLFFTVLVFILHIIFFLLQIYLRFYMFSDVTDSVMYMWSINIIYLLIAGFLNFRDSLCVRRLFFMIKNFYFLKI